MNLLSFSAFFLFCAVSASAVSLRVLQSTTDDGGCYNPVAFSCGCDDDRCSKEKCEELEMVWTDTCPDYCNATECDASTEVYEDGGCYDPVAFSCGCDDDRCSKEKCEELDMIWTDTCPDYCNATECYAGSDNEDGGCYNPIAHSCGCDDDRCTKEMCDGIGMVWTDTCPDYCNATECMGDNNEDIESDENVEIDDGAGLNPVEILLEALTGVLITLGCL